MTTFLISPMTDEQIEYGGDEGSFQGQEGILYNYEVELDLEDQTVRITDGCNRTIPFDLSDLSSLILVLSKINRYVQTRSIIEDRLYQELISGYHQKPDSECSGCFATCGECS